MHEVETFLFFTLRKTFVRFIIKAYLPALAAATEVAPPAPAELATASTLAAVTPTPSVTTPGVTPAAAVSVVEEVVVAVAVVPLVRLRR